MANEGRENNVGRENDLAVRILKLGFGLWALGFGLGYSQGERDPRTYLINA